MSQITRNERDIFKKALRDAFASADGAETRTEPCRRQAEDLEFLEALEANALSDEERAEFVRRLAECPHCREQFVAQVKFGGLFADASQDEPISTIRPGKTWKNRSRSRTFSLLTSAALLAVVVGVALWGVSGGDRGGELASRLNELRQVEALDDFSPNLNETFGYRFSGASSTEGMENPLIKGAFDAEPSETANAPADFAANCAVFEEALKVAPNDGETRLDYVRYLIKTRQNLRRADEILASTEPQTLETALLTGVSAFLQNDAAVAQAAFRKALEFDGANEVALLNLAICLSRSENPDDQNAALEIYRGLLETTKSVELKERIELYLFKTPTSDASE